MAVNINPEQGWPGIRQGRTGAGNAYRRGECCDRTAVRYLGKIVELGDTKTLFDHPRHPYTRSLPSAIPEIGGRRVADEFWLGGEPPDPGDLPSGCRLRTRCPMARAAIRPPLIPTDIDQNPWAH